MHKWLHKYKVTNDNYLSHLFTFFLVFFKYFRLSYIAVSNFNITIIVISIIIISSSIFIGLGGKKKNPANLIKGEIR